MKVLHITNNYPTEKHPIFGIFVKEQVESLSFYGINCEILFINGREKGKIEYVKSIWSIKRLLKKERFDLIHCHHALSALILILSGAYKQNKILVSFQNDPIHELGRWIFLIIKKNTHGWIFKNNSSFIKDEYSFYLPNGVNTSLFKPLNRSNACKKLNLDLGKRYILFVSSNKFRRQKRYDRFKATLNILQERNQNIEELTLINTNRKLVPLYFNAASVHLMTSDFEGSPNSVKEAMACNIPVVSTDVGNVREVVENVKDSSVSKSTNPSELAKLVEIALASSSHNGREIIIQRGLDINSVAIKLKGIYLKILEI